MYPHKVHARAARALALQLQPCELFGERKRSSIQSKSARRPLSDASTNLPCLALTAQNQSTEGGAFALQDEPDRDWISDHRRQQGGRRTLLSSWAVRQQTVRAPPARLSSTRWSCRPSICGQLGGSACLLHPSAPCAMLGLPHPSSDIGHAHPEAPLCSHPQAANGAHDAHDGRRSVTVSLPGR